VDANAITQLLSRPLGVKGVTNPFAAAGGADPEPIDEVRRNAPVGITALDRLVSVTDYADFARAFAGVARSSAALLADGTRRLVHVTVAGRDGDPIPPDTDLYKNLLQALRKYGEPGTAVAVDSRVLRFLRAEARIRVHPDHEFAAVEAAVRTRLLAAFGFDARDFARPLYLSEFVAAAQAVTGVVAVNVTRFALINELGPASAAAAPEQSDLEQQLKYLSEQLRAPAERLPERLAVRTARFADGKIVPAELAFLPARVPDLLTLTEWK
jgi:predicted phage baseplate assembly protein